MDEIWNKDLLNIQQDVTDATTIFGTCFKKNTHLARWCQDMGLEIYKTKKKALINVHYVAIA